LNIYIIDKNERKRFIETRYKNALQHVVKNIRVDDATARFSLTTKFINGGYESSQ